MEKAGMEGATAAQPEAAPAMAAQPEQVPLPRQIFLDEATARFDAAKRAEIGFVERLVWFWSNHFCVNADATVMDGMMQENKNCQVPTGVTDPGKDVPYDLLQGGSGGSAAGSGAGPSTAQGKAGALGSVGDVLGSLQADRIEDASQPQNHVAPAFAGRRAVIEFSY
jgi:hypothetical protein